MTGLGPCGWCPRQDSNLDTRFRSGIEFFRRGAWCCLGVLFGLIGAP